MKLTATQLRRIIAEEVSRLTEGEALQLFDVVEQRKVTAGVVPDPTIGAVTLNFMVGAAMAYSVNLSPKDASALGSMLSAAGGSTPDGSKETKMSLKAWRQGDLLSLSELVSSMLSTQGDAIRVADAIADVAEKIGFSYAEINELRRDMSEMDGMEALAAGTL